jgi:hypothetical protein
MMTSDKRYQYRGLNRHMNELPEGGRNEASRRDSFANGSDSGMSPSLGPSIHLTLQPNYRVQRPHGSY